MKSKHIDMRLLTELKHQTGKTLILVTHDPRIARQCDRAVSMHDGRLVDEPIAVRA